MLVWQIRNLTEARAYAQRDSDVRGGIVDYMRVQYAECFLSCYCYRRLGNQNIKLVRRSGIRHVVHVHERPRVRQARVWPVGLSKHLCALPERSGDEAHDPIHIHGQGAAPIAWTAVASRVVLESQFLRQIIITSWVRVCSRLDDCRAQRAHDLEGGCREFWSRPSFISQKIANLSNVCSL